MMLKYHRGSPKKACKVSKIIKLIQINQHSIVSNQQDDQNLLDKLKETGKSSKLQKTNTEQDLIQTP